MSNTRAQLNLRTIFLVLTIVASLVALYGMLSKPVKKHSAFWLGVEQIQLEQAMEMRIEYGELNFPPELDNAEQLVYVLGGFGGAPMHYDFSADQLVDVDLDRHPEYAAWDPDIPFVLDNGKVRWIHRATGDILDIEEVVKLLPKRPSALYGLIAFGTFIASSTILLWRSKFLEPFFALLIVLLILAGLSAAGSPAN